MSVSDVFLLIVRWLHLTSAAAWVGGSLVYVLVLRPVWRRRSEPAGSADAEAASEFRVLVDTCIFVLLATGIILTFDRLTPGNTGVSYVVTLAAKIVLSVWMFALVRGRRRRIALLVGNGEDTPSAPTGIQRVGRALSRYNAVVILGIVVFLLSDLLKVLFEMSLSEN